MKTVRYTKLETKVLNDWMRLWKKSNSASLVNGPQWFLSVLETFHYTKFLILAIYEHDVLKGITGLIKSRRYGASVYTLLPADFVYGTPFLTDESTPDTLKELVKELLLTGTIVFDSVSMQSIRELEKYTKSITYTKNSVNYALHFNRDEKGNVVIRKRNILLKPARDIQDHLSVKSFHSESAGEALPIAFAIDSQGRKERRGYSAFSREETRNFYLSLAKRFKENFLLNILYFNDQPIVYEIGFRIGSSYIGSQIASLMSYDKYSIIRVTLIAVIDLLNATGIKKFDFGTGDAPIKRSFTKDYENLYHVIITKSFFTGTYLKHIFALRNTLYDSVSKHKYVYMLYRNIRKGAIH